MQNSKVDIGKVDWSRNVYRPHRGGLNESMSEAFNFTSLEKLAEQFEQRIEVSYYGYDDRLKKETYLVRDDIGVLGFITWGDEHDM